MSFIIQEQAGGLYASDIETAVYPVTLPASITSISVITKVINLTSTTEMLLFTSNNGVTAVVFDSVANTFGAMVLVRASVSLAAIGAVKMSSTQVLVSTLVASTTALETVVLSVSGTTITVNTPLATTLGAVATLLTQAETLINVGSSYVLGYTRSGLSYVIAFTVSGTTVTAGSELSSGLGSAPANVSILIPYSSSLFVYGASVGGLTMSYLPVSVSGTTLTNGTVASDQISPNGSIKYGISSNGNILVAARSSVINTTLRGAVITITGTVASISGVDLLTGLSAVTDASSSIVIGNQMMVNAGNLGSAGPIITGLTDVAGVATAAVNYFTGSFAQIVGYDNSGVVFVRDGSNGFYYARFSGNDVVCTPQYFIRFNSAQQFISMSSLSAIFSNWNTQTSLLRTTSGKQCSTVGVSSLLYSYQLNQAPIVQQVAEVSGTGFIRSTLSEAQGWYSIRSGLNGLIQKVVLT